MLLNKTYGPADKHRTAWSRLQNHVSQTRLHFSYWFVTSNVLFQQPTIMLRAQAFMASSTWASHCCVCQRQNREKDLYCISLLLPVSYWHGNLSEIRTAVTKPTLKILICLNISNIFGQVLSVALCEDHVTTMHIFNQQHVFINKQFLSLWDAEEQNALFQSPVLMLT